MAEYNSSPAVGDEDKANPQGQLVVFEQSPCNLPTEWTILENLVLTHAVQKCGENSWATVSRVLQKSLKTLQGNPENPLASLCAEQPNITFIIVPYRNQA